MTTEWNVAVIGFYHPINYFNRIIQGFSTRHWKAHFFPLFQYVYDANDKLPQEEYIQKLVDFLIDNNIRIILWIFLEVDKIVFEQVVTKYPQGYYIAFNIDDPYNVKVETLERLTYFQQVVTPYQFNISRYKAVGVSNVHYQKYPGDTITYKPLSSTVIDEMIASDPKYQYCPCDIAMYCETLLDLTPANRQVINQIGTWATERGWKFRIFGCTQLQKWWPDYYKWDPQSPLEICLIYNCAKVLINLSVNSRYINRYQFDILACGKATISNYQHRQVPWLKADGYHYIAVECPDGPSLEHRLLMFFESYQAKYGRRRLALKNNWQKFTDFILKLFVSDNFSSSLCYSLYQPRISDGQELYWAIKRFKRKGIYCWNWRVPDDFRAKDYYKSLSPNEQERHRLAEEWPGRIENLYLHWMIKCQDKFYLSRKHKGIKSNMNGGTIISNIADTCERTIEGLAILKDLAESRSVDKSQVIERLIKYIKCNPRVDVNKLVESYMLMRLY